MTLARWAAPRVALRSSLIAVALLAMLALVGAVNAAAAPGGMSARESEAPTEGEPATETAAPVSNAMLVNGRAVAPLDAPPAVKKVIAAANKIRTKPYIWGGGHGRWWDRGYDCSGAVSFALRGGSLIDSPMPSGPMMGWGAAGLGRWITVFANSGHAYAVIAGLRWDTSGTGGSGPRWHEDMRSRAGFAARHPTGY
jgi:cell wall-associated NlpC family hydrolase